MALPNIIINFLACAVLGQFMLFLLVTYAFEDKIIKEIITGPDKIKNIWKKKARISLVVSSFMETDEYRDVMAKIKAHSPVLAGQQ